ncbi:MAG: class I SAM-dependent methyltransferase [Lachnospiraceae bacterium]|nr:class I SAM-dependent methyltransferase [Lachnospiraceae bacterium]
MIEEIGKVKLDYGEYLGKDLYSDGEVENELLDIVKNRTITEYAKIIEQKKSWPILYHLSPLRENIINWLPWDELAGGGTMGTPGNGVSSGMWENSMNPADLTRSENLLNLGNDMAAVNAAAAMVSRENMKSVSAGLASVRRGAKVLEVGSGCGAITGALAENAGEVICVELSKKRSLINAYRHRECGNVTIHVGNFKDIEPNLPTDFDLICLIGVFEYAKEYMGGNTPYEDFLKILLSHLAPEGRLVIAIENQYGLKYFAGCKEDHLGSYFSGIENYQTHMGVRTFSREGLERIFQSCGVKEWHFYYPYPDYKFVTTLYSDEFLPKKGELSNNLRNFDRDRMLLFDEKAAFDGILEDGLFPVFSNSYLAVLGREFDTKYVKFSNDRAPEYAIRTEIASRMWHRQRLITVRKYPQTSEAQDHIRGMAAAYESMKEKYEGGSLEINHCDLVDQGGLVYAQFEYVPGIPLSELMDDCLERNDLEGFYGYFKRYMERIGYNNEYPAADFDPIFSNILVWTEELRTEESEGRENEMPLTPDSMGNGESANGQGAEGSEEAGAGSTDTGKGEPGLEGISEGKAFLDENVILREKWTLIDYEWTFGRAIDIKELAFRAVYCYLLEDGRRNRLNLGRVLQELSITEEMAEAYRQQEREFQCFVTGERLSMPQMREVMGHRAMVPQKWIDRYQDSELVNRVQIYQDRGGGYSEEESYFVEEAYQGDQLIDVKLQVGGDVKMLRIDPSMSPCVVKIKEMTFNGETVPLDKKKMITANGRIVKPSKENAQVYCPSIVFATEDPNINISLGELPCLAQNSLRMRMEIVRLPLSMAQDLAETKGMRWFGN